MDDLEGSTPVAPEAAEGGGPQDNDAELDKLQKDPDLAKAKEFYTDSGTQYEKITGESRPALMDLDKLGTLRDGLHEQRDYPNASHLSKYVRDYFGTTSEADFADGSEFSKSWGKVTDRFNYHSKDKAELERTEPARALLVASFEANLGSDQKEGEHGKEHHGQRRGEAIIRQALLEDPSARVKEEAIQKIQSSPTRNPEEARERVELLKEAYESKQGADVKDKVLEAVSNLGRREETPELREVRMRFLKSHFAEAKNDYTREKIVSGLEPTRDRPHERKMLVYSLTTHLPEESSSSVRSAIYNKLGKVLEPISDAAAGEGEEAKAAQAERRELLGGINTSLQELMTQTGDDSLKSELINHLGDRSFASESSIPVLMEELRRQVYSLRPSRESYSGERYRFTNYPKDSEGYRGHLIRQIGESLNGIYTATPPELAGKDYNERDAHRSQVKETISEQFSKMTPESQAIIKQLRSGDSPGPGVFARRKMGGYEKQAREALSTFTR